MLPTKGYFQDIECPFYNTTCGRPYCHFRHKRKANEIVEEPSQETAKTTVPTYKPTPKSELASIHSQRSHIPISYVPDLSYKRDRHIRPIKIDKPTYNPTPLSILSSATQADPSETELNNSTIRNIQENIASTVYDPLKSEINFEELSNEFEAIDNIIESVHEEPQTVINENLDEVNSKIKKESDELSLSPSDRELDIKNGDASKADLFDSFKDSKASKTEDLFDQLKKEKLVEIKKEPEEVTLKSEKSDKKRSDKDPKKSDKNHRDDKDSKNSSRSKNSSSAKEKSIKDKDNKTSKEKEEKKSDKSSASFHKSKERDKHRKAEKKDSSKSKSSSKDKERRKSKDHDKKKSKTKSESTNCSESEGSSTVSSPERHRKEKKKASSSKAEVSSSSNKEKSIIIKSHRSRSKEKAKKKSSRKSKSRSRSKSKEKAKKKSLRKSQSRSRSRSKSKEKAKKKSSRKSKSRSRSRSKSKEKAKKKSSRKSKSRSRSRSMSKEKASEKAQKKSSRKSQSRSRSRSRSKENVKKKSSKKSKSRSRSRSKSREKAKKKSSRKSQSRSRSRSKSKEKHKHKSSGRTKHHEDNSKNKDKVSKEKDTKSKDRESRLKSSNSKNAEESSQKDKEIPVDSPKQDDLDTNDIVIINTEDVLPDDIDLDLEDEDETLKECYRIFNEYKPEPIKKPLDEGKDESTFEYVPTQIKKRRAHDGADLSTTHYKLPTVAPPKSVTLPGQILANRYKIARMAQASNEQQSIMNEIKTMTQTAKRPASSLLEAARLHKIKRLQKTKEKEKPKDNIVDDILNGLHKPSVPLVKVPSKKIAAVPNVALIEKAKKRISLVKKQREEENVKTIAHTTKGGRVAHVPEYTLDELPDVLQADRSKLPVNVRSRFLTMIAEECAKLYASKDDAYNRALNEEFSCYEKCKVLATYRNSAMLAVNRLRKEIQERDSKGLGRLLSGESSSNKKESNFEGSTFYKNVKKWILTSEELDIHGYPRESSEKGMAIINNRAEIDFSIVDENQRRCSRCGTVYQVDDEGWPLFDEECMYHPMKKRTIRREQVYLCCKSSEETGCAMSDTHVFDGLPKHLLEGYQTTLPPESEDDPRSTQVYALDCEMCYTTKGLELTRVTVVDTECKTVYESLVKPMNPIIDYNTRFSGITKDQMDRTGTNILQVQANILHLCNSETILVGHSLESDMKALKIIHGTIIDTSVLFPHKMGLPHKKALRGLASEYLQKIIQNDVSGHDSAEDAIACMDLIKWKLKEELKTKVK